MNMIKPNLTLLLILLLFSVPTLLIADEDNCLSCHQEFEEEDGPSYLISKDIHFQKGLSCISCHGGDPSLEDMDEVREGSSYRGVPDRLEIPNFCASCHSDASYMQKQNSTLPTNQLQEYKKSTHGKRLFNEKDTSVATCVSCHSIHQIADERLPHSSTNPLNLPNTCGTCHASSEYMADYDIETNQLDDFSHSVHGIALLVNKDIGSPACNDCHGNHGADLDDAESLIDACGNCHAVEADLFRASPHREAYEENDLPMCVTCHSNHLIIKPSDTLIGSQEPALCADCHSPDDGTLGAITADSMLTFINQLKTANDNARLLLSDAHNKGMMTLDAEFLLKEAAQSLILTRTRIHSFNLDSLRPSLETGLAVADSARVKAANLIDDYYFRRKGLALASLFITLTAIGLYLRIRRLE